MKLIQILALSVVVLYLTQENKTNGFKIIKVPIYVAEGIFWISVKVPVKFAWSILRFPTKIILKLAWMISKRPILAITPHFLEYNIRKLIKEYKIEKKQRKKEKSKRHRMKVSIKKGISNINNGIHRMNNNISRVNNRISSRFKKINWGKRNKRQNAHPANQQMQINQNRNIVHG